MECGRVLRGPMGGVGARETGSAESSAAVTGTAAAEASATGASRRYKMFSLLARTQSSRRRRLRWRESDSREAGILSSARWFSAALRLLLRYDSRRWAREDGGCTAAPAGMFAIWGRGGGGAFSRDSNGLGIVSGLLARHDHQGQPKQATQTAIINCRSSAGGGQTGREAQSDLICGGEYGIGQKRAKPSAYAGLTKRGETGS